MAVRFMEMAVSKLYDGVKSKKETIMSTNNSNLLRNALYGNAVFSGLCGIAFTIFSKPISNFLGISASWIILVVGIGLAGYAWLIYTAAKANPVNTNIANFAIYADLIWVIVSAVLIFTNFMPFTTSGKWAIAIVADILDRNTGVPLGRRQAGETADLDLLAARNGQVVVGEQKLRRRRQRENLGIRVRIVAAPEHHVKSFQSISLCMK